MVCQAKCVYGAFVPVNRKPVSLKNWDSGSPPVRKVASSTYLSPRCLIISGPGRDYSCCFPARSQYSREQPSPVRHSSLSRWRLSENRQQVNEAGLTSSALGGRHVICHQIKSLTFVLHGLGMGKEMSPLCGTLPLG
jgi:hypothetical protein